MMLWRALAADALKLRRSLVLLIGLLLPALAVLAVTLGLVHTGLHGFAMARSGPGAFYVTYVLQTWLLTVWPLFVALLTALLHGMDHANGNYRYLLGLPVPRWALVGSKLLWAMALSALALALAVLGVSMFFGLKLLAWLRPDAGLGVGWPLPAGLALLPLVWLASLLLISLHDWVALRFAGMVSAMAVGLAATLLTVVASSAEFGRISPWVLPLQIGNSVILHVSPWPAVVQSLCAMPLVVALMLADTRRREFV